jgi:hypothetical protein
VTTQNSPILIATGSAVVAEVWNRPQQSTMPRTKNPDYIDWKNSEAREVIMFDLLEGILPLSADAITAEEAWEIYRDLPEFSRVVFQQFKERLRDHRKQITQKKCQTAQELQALAHDQALHPRHSHNERGEVVFDLHAAKRLLQDDIKAKKHERLVPSALQATRPEYILFKPEIFKHRIYQEIRRQKYIFYLNLKRAEAKRRQRGRTENQASNHP